MIFLNFYLLPYLSSIYWPIILLDTPIILSLVTDYDFWFG